MPENVNKMASCAKFFNVRAFANNRNRFFDPCIIYLSVNKITKSEDDHFKSKQNHCVKGATLI